MVSFFGENEERIEAEKLSADAKRRAFPQEDQARVEYDEFLRTPFLKTLQDFAQRRIDAVDEMLKDGVGGKKLDEAMATELFNRKKDLERITDGRLFRSALNTRINAIHAEARREEKREEGLAATRAWRDSHGGQERTRDQTA